MILHLVFSSELTLALLTQPITPKFSSSETGIYSALWNIFRPDGRDGFENALSVVVLGPSSSDGALID